MSESRSGRASSFRAWPTLTALQRTFITAGVNQGLGSNRIYVGLQDAGIGGNRQRILAAISERRDTVGSGASLHKVVPSFIPSDSIFQPWDYPQKATYRVWASYTAVSSITGMSETYHAVIAYNEQLTREQIDQRLMSVLENASNATGPGSKTGGFVADPSLLQYTTLEMKA